MLSGQQTTEEFRRQGRQRTLLSAKIILGDATISHDCSVRNLSATGARVRLAAALELPRSLRLLLIRSAVVFDATIAWRFASEVGLKFTAEHDLRGEVGEDLRHARALWQALAVR